VNLKRVPDKSEGCKVYLVSMVTLFCFIDYNPYDIVNPIYRSFIAEMKFFVNKIKQSKLKFYSSNINFKFVSCQKVDHCSQISLLLV